uniref:DUF2442 domain-containing protein n=1 Tax=Candidatus Kentrum sp. SD TaxID=2126332 RepID=A0A451BHS9_9GAMM|nr:MAG: Protein of unknown function (DUF2442) [Candidatus Kentron sp. SD]VFK42564.1 MAG: Protein of unknown function (DUF2442) [Candidatus Kentron sp. SD]VFK77850.1 MAG: Protein of unknown function (DUF2442) [Candidatus Kentron sp. SD]
MHPSVTKVTATENYRVRVEFDNSESGVPDMAPYLGFGVFRKLKDPAVCGSLPSPRIKDNFGW